MKNSRVGVVIVAGGLSSRMKDFKPLMSIGQKTMIETTISNFRAVGIDEIVIVTGFRAMDIEKKLDGYNVKFVKNENYKSTQMFDSVCIGLKELQQRVDMIFITPSDSPFVQKFTLEKLVEEIENSKLKIVQPSYDGKNGHPLLLSKEAVDIMLEHDGTMGMQGAIAKISGYKNIGFIDPGIVKDADVINDYLKLLEYNESKSCPNVELCEKIQDYFHMPDNVKKHCSKVAQAALDICYKLPDEGISLDKGIIVAASMLHDIAKGIPKHDEVGAGWLRDMGYSYIANIVEEHMELRSVGDTLTEKEVVYLADKMVKEDELVTIDERFLYKENLYEGNNSLAKVVEKRKEQALKIYNMISQNV